MCSSIGSSPSQLRRGSVAHGRSKETKVALHEQSAVVESCMPDAIFLVTPKLEPLPERSLHCEMFWVCLTHQQRESFIDPHCSVLVLLLAPPNIPGSRRRWRQLFKPHLADIYCRRPQQSRPANLA